MKNKGHIGGIGRNWNKNCRTLNTVKENSSLTNFLNSLTAKENISLSLLQEIPRLCKSF